MDTLRSVPLPEVDLSLISDDYAQIPSLQKVHDRLVDANSHLGRKNMRDVKSVTSLFSNLGWSYRPSHSQHWAGCMFCESLTSCDGDCSYDGCHDKQDPSEMRYFRGKNFALRFMFWKPGSIVWPATMSQQSISASRIDYIMYYSSGVYGGLFVAVFVVLCVMCLSDARTLLKSHG